MDQNNMSEQKTRNEKRYLIDFDQIMLDYNWEKNASFDPARITKGSNKKIEWKCHVCGHEWVATPYTRITANHGCHMCAVRNRSQRTVKDSAESIGNLVPESLTYWDYENNHFTPFEVSSMSSKIIHWKCQNGHSWVAKASKFSIGQRCPYCIGKKVLTGYNDLATKRPDLMGEWDYERNIAIDPRTTYYLSQQYAWWTCVNSHSWKAKISARQTTGCPYCNNKKVSKENNLEQNYPQLASEWN